MKQIILITTFIVFLFSKTFTVSYDPDYAPFCYGTNAQGILVDIWKLWAKKNNYKIKFINGKTWEKAINLAKEGKVDFFIGTDPYEEWMKSSKSFYKIKTALFVKDGFKSKIKIIGIIGEDYEEDLLHHFKDNNHKNIFSNTIEIKSYETYKELFQALKTKKVDAIYDDYLALLYYAIKHQNMFIKQIPNFSFSSDVKAISNNQKNIELFNQGFKNITYKELQEIEQKWNIQLAKTSPKYMKYFFLIVMIILVVVVMFILINIKLKNIIKQKTKSLEELNEQLEEKVKQRTKELEIKTIEANNSNRAKARFLANMSHEIRTPLNSIIGFATLLQEEELTPSAQRYVNIIEESSKNLLGVINDILDFSKIEEGKLSIEKVAFNLNEEIDNITQMFYQKADDKNITFKIIKDNIDVNIVTDPTRFRQIVLNLLSNAFKFTDEDKKIEIIVKYKNEQIFVSVKDEGIGISQEKLSTIFEDFTQADDSTTRKYGGSGLGLSISSSLVKLLGGELKVKSKINQGSEFYFSIPAKEGKIAKKESKIKSEQFNYHLLLVEDNKANQMFMSVILQKMGCSFDVANDGIEAIELYKKNYTKYDLILMDENMPNMTGSIATQKIREFEIENNIKSIYIVALTANALTGDKDKFIQAGMNDYLSKPLNIEKLIAIFRKMV